MIGAGVSGAILARRLAEMHYMVHVYERSEKYGGLAAQGHYPFSLVSSVAHDFLQSRVKIFLDERGYYPEKGWSTFCERMLEHKNICALHSAGITDIELLASEYPLIFSTASPDGLFSYAYGELGYYQGVPLWQKEDVERYNNYMLLTSHYHIVPLGASGTYKYLTIEQCIVRALQTADIYAAYLRNRESGITAQVTWQGE